MHRSNPESHIYIAQLAEIYDHLGRYAEESAMWEQFLDHAPMPIEGCPQIGQSYEKQKRWADALRAFERCLAIDPDSLDSMFMLAHAHEQHGSIEKAEELYRKGYALRPSYSDFGT